MQRVVQVAGLALELSADDAARWRAIDALFAACAESPAEPQIRLRFDHRPPPLPARPPDLAFTGIDVWLGSDGAASRNAAGVAARRHGDEIHVGWPGGDERRGDPDTGRSLDLVSAFRRSVQHVLADALAEHGRHTIHAASIAHGDRVVIATGGTGAGKSTLAYAASRRRWSVLSDDLTFVSGDGDGLLATGLPKPLNVPRDLLGTGFDGGSAIDDDARRRVRLPIDGVAGEPAGRVAAVLLVEHARGAGHLEPLEQGPSLLKTILTSFPLAPDRRRMRELFPIAGAISRLPAWALHHDIDPARRLDVAGGLLDRIGGELGELGGPGQ